MKYRWVFNWNDDLGEVALEVDLTPAEREAVSKTPWHAGRLERIRGSLAHTQATICTPNSRRSFVVPREGDEDEFIDRLLEASGSM